MQSVAKYLFGLALVFCVASMAQAQPGGGRGFGGGFGGGGSRLGLLRMEAVQKELGLTEDQIASIRKLSEELRPMGRGGRGGGEGGQPRRGGRRGGGENNPDARVGGVDQFFVQAEQPRRGQLSDEDRAKMREEAAARAKKEREELAKILKPEQLKRLTEIYIQQAGVGALQDPDVAEKLKISDEQKEKMAKVREEQGAAMRELFAAGRDGDREAARKKFEEARKQTEEKTLAVLTEDQKKQFEELKGKKFDMPENAGRRPGGRGGDRGERPTN